MNLFGKKKKKSKENKNEQKVNEAIQKLKESLEQITKRENHLNAQIEETRNHARVKLQKGDRQGATLEIRREKLMRNEILNNFSKKLNLDATILALESASSNKVVLEAVKQSKQALHDMMKESNVDDYAEIMDETNEMMMNVNEINEALAHPIGAYTDEDDIERELDEMAIQENEEIEALERLVSVKNGRETKAKEKISESERVATTLQKQGSNGKLSGKERELEELRKLEALLG